MCSYSSQTLAEVGVGMKCDSNNARVLYLHLLEYCNILYPAPIGVIVLQTCAIITGAVLSWAILIHLKAWV